MRHVYRVENDYGEGPYREDTAYHGDWYDVPDTHHNDSAHPSPWEEGLKLTLDRKCCFTTLKQLNEWFTRTELANLKALGFEVTRVEYEPGSIDKASKQATFIPLFGD